jgi:tetratricopeptide (TPR) repeat protein
MSHSIDRSRRERELVKRSRYGRYDIRRRCQAAIYDDPDTSAPKRPSQIPIRIVDPHPYAHHPASPADIRAILGKQPEWFLNGLDEIHLCRGAEEDLRPAPGTIEEHHVVDAWIKRRGTEILPGIYSGQLLGHYLGGHARIQIYSIAYRPDLPARAMWDVLLRRDALATLVHEIGHHRWTRLRFPPGQEPSSEEYAKRYEYAGVKRHVLPYLEAAYPAEVDRLLSWIEGHVGIRLSLASLYPDWSNGYVRAFSGVTPGSAVEHLVEALADGTGPRELRRDFARDIHYGEKYDEALRIVELLLRDDPNDFDALDLRACIARDQDQRDEAQALARDLTIRFPLRYRAWDRLVSANEDLQDWRGALDATSAILALPEFSGLRPYERDDTFLSRAQAHYELGKLDAAIRDLDQVSDRVTRRKAEQIAELRSKIAEQQPGSPTEHVFSAASHPSTTRPPPDGPVLSRVATTQW